MKKLLYLCISMSVCLVLACTKYEYWNEETIVNQVLEDFYINHLRYPRTAIELADGFYKADSVNDFNFLRSLLNTNKTIDVSNQLYFQSLDSLTSNSSLYLKWILLFKNHPDDFVFSFSDDSIIIVDNYHKSIITERNANKIFETYVENEMQLKEWDIQKYLLLHNIIRTKLCNKDSIVVSFPDSVMDTLLPTAHLFRYGTKLFKHKNIKLHDYDINKSLVRLRYNKDAGITDLYNRSIKVYDTDIVHYLDSLIDLDERIDFIQFCISPIVEDK